MSGSDRHMGPALASGFAYVGIKPHSSWRIILSGGSRFPAKLKTGSSAPRRDLASYYLKSRTMDQGASLRDLGAVDVSPEGLNGLT